MIAWFYLLLSFVLGFLGGAVFMHFRAKPLLTRALEAEGLEAKLKEQEQELKTYKAQVGDHFVETAALVNQLSQTYKDVYQHLEKGAYSLVGEEDLHKRLKDVSAEPVMLEYIGQKRIDLSLNKVNEVGLNEDAIKVSEEGLNEEGLEVSEDVLKVSEDVLEVNEDRQNEDVNSA